MMPDGWRNKQAEFSKDWGRGGGYFFTGAGCGGS